MNKILRLDDSPWATIPKHLELLLERIRKQRSDDEIGKLPSDHFLPVECDVIFSVALILALEEGFRLDDSYPTIGYDFRAFESLQHLPDFRAKNDTHSIELKLPRVDQLTFFMIAASVLGDCTLITMGSFEKDTARIFASKIVPHKKFLEMKNKGRAMFINLNKLCNQLREPVNEIKREALRSAELFSVDIEGLPDDLKRYLFKKMRTEDFLSLCKVSADMYQYINEESIWRYFLARDFDTEPLPGKTSEESYQVKASEKPPTPLPIAAAFRRLLEESTRESVPKHLELLMERMAKQRYGNEVAKLPSDYFLPVECDIIFAVALIFALEEGFRVDNSYPSIGYDCRVFESLLDLPDFSTKNGTYSVELRLPRVDTIKFHLVAANVFDECTLITMASFKKEIARLSSSTVISHKKFLSMKSKGAAAFLDLPGLCSRLRKPVVFVKIDALRSVCVFSADIVGLPDDLKRLIFKRLRVGDFISFCKVSSHMHQYALEEDIWRYYLKRDFKADPLPGVSAIDAYQSKVKQKPSTSTASTTYHNTYEDHYRAASDFSFDLPPLL